MKNCVHVTFFSTRSKNIGWLKDINIVRLYESYIIILFDFMENSTRLTSEQVRKRL